MNQEQNMSNNMGNPALKFTGVHEKNMFIAVGKLVKYQFNFDDEF